MFCRTNFPDKIKCPESHLLPFHPRTRGVLSNRLMRHNRPNHSVRFFCVCKILQYPQMFLLCRMRDPFLLSYLSYPSHLLSFLGGNRLTNKIVEGITFPDGLKVLVLKGNCLTQITHNMTFPKKLKWIDLCNNSISEVRDDLPAATQTVRFVQQSPNDHISKCSHKPTLAFAGYKTQQKYIRRRRYEACTFVPRESSCEPIQSNPPIKIM